METTTASLAKISAKNVCPGSIPFDGIAVVDIGTAPSAAICPTVLRAAGSAAARDDGGSGSSAHPSTAGVAAGARSDLALGTGPESIRLDGVRWVPFLSWWRTTPVLAFVRIESREIELRPLVSWAYLPGQGRFPTG